MKKYHSKGVSKVTSVELMVKDINVSLNFYQNVLGMKLLEQNNKTYHLGTEDSKPLIKLVENKFAQPKIRSTGLYHFALLMPERKHLGQLINHFIAIKQYITGGSDHGVSEALYLNDPDGNGIEIYTDKPDNVWKILENNQIKMETLPLDYEDLVANAYSNYDEYANPFAMPKGTIMGHVHYHVSNLQQAKEFFVGVLGFQTTLDFNNTALFLSDKRYHHHIGLNVWNGENAKNNPDDVVGLKSYDLSVRKDNFYKIISNLTDKNISILEQSENSAKFKDVNNVTVNMFVE